MKWKDSELVVVSRMSIYSSEITTESCSNFHYKILSVCDDERLRRHRPLPLPLFLTDFINILATYGA